MNDLSSAHVYLRLPVGKTMEDIPEKTLEDCVQLVKANSIQGNKLNNIEVVYTPWGNLKKTASNGGWPGELDHTWSPESSQ